MGHAELDFIGAATTQHYRAERPDVTDTEIQIKANIWRSKLETLDLSDLCCSDALMGAVMTGHKELMGEVLAALVDAHCKSLAEREIFGESATDDEHEAVKALNAGIAKRVAA